MQFDALLQKLSPVLKQICRRLCGSGPALGADDLYQEAVLHLWQSFHRGALEDKTRSYILQGCYFYLKNYLRKAKAYRRYVSLEAMDNEADGLRRREKIFGQRHNSREFWQRQDCRLLADTIMNNGLEPREKQILAFCAEGLTLREIGRALGVSHVRVVKLIQGIRVKCLRYRE